MSKMSYDRVHFKINERYLKRDTYIDCLVEVFGLDRQHLMFLSKKHQDLHVICRPSQFARFVILRHVKYGENNSMADLDMKLVVPEPETSTVQDVSSNPNTVNQSYL